MYTGKSDEFVRIRSIMEILRVLKENQARDHALAVERSHQDKENDRAAASRHAGGLEAIRAELKEWQAKRAELEKTNRDPGNQAGT